VRGRERTAGETLPVTTDEKRSGPDYTSAQGEAAGLAASGMSNPIMENEQTPRLQSGGNSARLLG
jgi:hypothetical protein